MCVRVSDWTLKCIYLMMKIHLIYIALFKLAAHIDKTSRTHARIIWSCAWSHDVCFATASRDKKVYYNMHHKSNSHSSYAGTLIVCAYRRPMAGFKKVYPIQHAYHHKSNSLSSYAGTPIICAYRRPMAGFYLQVYLWSQKSAVEGAKDCGDGWRVASPPLECSTAVTAVDFAPVQLKDERYMYMYIALWQ